VEAGLGQQPLDAGANTLIGVEHEHLDANE
jgi:hypothetical protein